MKRCSKCGVEKAVSEFYRNSRQRSGLMPSCKLCFNKTSNNWNRANPQRRREYVAKWQRENRKKTYVHRRRSAWRRQGMNPDAAQAMLAAHGGTCDICGAASPGGNGGWHVDHDHDSGLVRGILCSGCDMGMGMIDRAGLEAVAAYIKPQHAKQEN